LLVVTHEQRISSTAGRIVRIRDGRIDQGPGAATDELAPTDGAAPPAEAPR
jgi:ABC-type lipoprotein export system ATPase subunit